MTRIYPIIQLSQSQLKPLGWEKLTDTITIDFVSQEQEQEVKLPLASASAVFYSFTDQAYCCCVYTYTLKLPWFTLGDFPSLLLKHSIISSKLITVAAVVVKGEVVIKYLYYDRFVILTLLYDSVCYSNAWSFTVTLILLLNIKYYSWW